jgi:hypothetical protein
MRGLPGGDGGLRRRATDVTDVHESTEALSRWEDLVELEKWMGSEVAWLRIGGCWSLN